MNFAKSETDAYYENNGDVDCQRNCLLNVLP